MKELDYHRSQCQKSGQPVQPGHRLSPAGRLRFLLSKPFLPNCITRGFLRLLLTMTMPSRSALWARRRHRLENLKQMILGKRVDGLIFPLLKQDDPLVDFAVETTSPSLSLGKLSHLSSLYWTMAILRPAMTRPDSPPARQGLSENRLSSRE